MRHVASLALPAFLASSWLAGHHHGLLSVISRLFRGQIQGMLVFISLFPLGSVLQTVNVVYTGYSYSPELCWIQFWPINDIRSALWLQVVRTAESLTVVCANCLLWSEPGQRGSPCSDWDLISVCLALVILAPSLTLRVFTRLRIRRWLQLRFDFDSTDVRFPFDCNSTALRPFDYLRYDRRPTCVWAAVLRPEKNKQVSVTTASGVHHSDLNDLW